MSIAINQSAVYIMQKPEKDVWRKALLQAIAIAGSQEALAEKVGVKQSYISWLVNRCSLISADMSRDIADAVGMERGEFRPDLWPLKESK